LPEELSQLMRLQVLDQDMREQAQALLKITGRIDELRVATEQAEGELGKLKAEEQQALLARKELERNLAEGEEQIRNKRMRLTLIRNERELQALGHEVESLKESNQSLEGEILARMEGTDQRAARLDELKGLIKQKRAELKAAEEEVAEEAEQLKSAITQRKVERDKLAEGIAPALRQRYEMLFVRRGGLAVALAKDGICQGCRRQIPPQLYNEIQKHQTIKYCPNCQRILYVEAQPANGPT
jgi:predicted  nucleic acid-binding Zn-ribbon protein